MVRGSVATGGGEEVEPQGRVLRLARRDLPRALVWGLIFGGPIVAFSWVLAAFGMVFVLVFLPMLDLGISTHDLQAMATVTHIEETSSTENERPIYRVRYTFLDAAGAEHRGESYSKSPPAELGSWRVDYRGGDPSESQLAGMLRRSFSALVLIVLVFPIAGLALVIWQLHVARRDLRLLRYGAETRGKLVDKRETRVHVNDVPIMALTFEYDVDGTRHTATVKTLDSRPLEDDEREAMLYDPHAPAHATTLDHLPGSPKVTPSGDLEARSGPSARARSRRDRGRGTVPSTAAISSTRPSSQSSSPSSTRAVPSNAGAGVCAGSTRYRHVTCAPAHQRQRSSCKHERRFVPELDPERERRARMLRQCSMWALAHGGRVDRVHAPHVVARSGVPG